MAEDETILAGEAAPAPAVPEAPKRRGGRKKTTAPAKAYPGVGDEPSPSDVQRAVAERLEAEEEAAGEEVKPPWPNATTPPVNPMTDPGAIKSQRDAIEAQRLQLAPGFRRYRAKRDFGSGKYRQGKTYVLPEPQSEALFTLVE